MFKSYKEIEYYVELLERIIEEQGYLVAIEKERPFASIDSNFDEFAKEQYALVDELKSRVGLSRAFYLDKVGSKNDKKLSRKKLVAGTIYSREDFSRLTRLLFDYELPKFCELCGSTENLHIHHKVYAVPILREHLQRLCLSCHLKAHHKKIRESY